MTGLEIVECKTEAGSSAKPRPELKDVFIALDDYYLEPWDGLELFENVGKTITLDLKMADLGNGAN